MLRGLWLACWALGLWCCLEAADVERIHRVGLEGSALEVELETKPGSPYRAAVVRRDLQRLWALDRFSDVRVRRETTPFGPDVVFEVTPRRRYALRQVRFEPASERRSLDGEPPPWIDQATAQAMGRELAAGLRRKGFLQAKVRGALEPVGKALADVVLAVEPGERLRVKSVEVAGVDGKQARKLRRSARELSPRTYIPGLFRLSRAFSAERLGRDVRSLHAALVAEGRLAATIEADVKSIGKDNRASVTFLVSPGPQFRIAHANVKGLSNVALKAPAEQFPADGLCAELQAARRKAEAQGRLGFSATIHALSQGPISDSGVRPVTLSAQTQAASPQTIRRIDFSGQTSLRNSSLRRALKLEEGDLLDAGRLRRDLARLSRFEALKPVTMDDVEIRPAGHGLADLLLHLEGRKSRRWSISGPLGPASLFGPLQALIETRLPPWGRDLLEASTYSAGFWLSGLPGAIATSDGWVWKTIYKPAFVVRRMSLPGQAGTSGWLWSPQLSRRANITSNAVGRSRHLLSKAVSGGPRKLALVAPIVGAGVSGELVCRDPKSWTGPARRLTRFLTGI